jgi:hypothetical protein
MIYASPVCLWKRRTIVSVVHIEINLDAETKHKVEVAAAEKKVSVNDYLVTAVQRQLENDAVEKSEIQPVSEEMNALIRNIRLRRERILAERNGEFIDVDAIIELVRNE